MEYKIALKSSHKEYLHIERAPTEQRPSLPGLETDALKVFNGERGWSDAVQVLSGDVNDLHAVGGMVVAGEAAGND